MIPYTQAFRIRPGLARALLLAGGVTLFCALPILFPFSALAGGAEFSTESYFGRGPARFGAALEDEEGRVVDFHANDRASGRSPASVKPRLDEAPEPSRVTRQLDHEDREEAETDSGVTRARGSSDSETETKVYRKPTRPMKSGSVYSTMEDDATGSEVGRDISSVRSPVGSSDSLAWNREETRLKDPFAGADSVTRRKGVQEVSVIANDLGFYPKTIFVSRSVPVRMFVTGASKNSTCLMMDAFNVRKQLRANKVEEITFVPNEAGTYRFYCPVNNSDGTLVVKELTP